MNKQLCDFCTLPASHCGVSFSVGNFNCLSLQKCVSRLLADLRGRTIKDGDIIFNDIPDEIFVSTNKEILTEIIRLLLRTILSNDRKNIIHISCKLIGNITLIHLRNSCTELNDDIAIQLQQIEPLAEKLGGCVTISDNKMYGLNLAFTFITH